MGRMGKAFTETVLYVIISIKIFTRQSDFFLFKDTRECSFLMYKKDMTNLSVILG